MTSVENPHAGQGPVMLDVGGEIGALLVRMPASMLGVEIEIRPQQEGLESSETRQPHSHAAPNSQARRHSHAAPNSQARRHSHDDGSPAHLSQVHLSHVEVLARPTVNGVVNSAVFPQLTQGCYELYVRPSGPVALVVTILGGQVTEVSWPQGA